MLVFFLSLTFYGVIGYQTIYTSDLYDVLFGNISTFRHSFLEESDDDSNDDETTMTKPTSNHMLDADPFEFRGQHVLLDFYNLNKQVQNITKKNSTRRHRGSWEEWYDKTATPEEYKKRRVFNTMVQFLLHSRFFISRVLRQREDIKDDKRFKLGYLFFKLRRMTGQQLKLYMSATLMNTSETRNQNLVLRMFEKVIRIQVDFMDTLKFTTSVYSVVENYDTLKPATTTKARRKKK